MKRLFSIAFRPLFFLAISYGILAIAWWGLAWAGYTPFPSGIANPIWWHGHEMLFGFVAAAVGGFALTAVANWTGRPPVSGWPLILLCALWLTARLLTLLAPPDLLLPLVLADLGYDLLLCVLVGREVRAAKNQRNFKLVWVLALYTAANACFYLGLWQGESWTQTALWGGLWLIILLINIIGGRIVPAFTANWLMMRAKQAQEQPRPGPPGFGRPDLIASLATAAFALLFLWQPEGALTAILAMIACVSQLWRWCRWQFYRTLGYPLVWILHLGFLWIPVGIALLGCAALGWLPHSAGVHALTTGAMTTMILAVASRAALGHTDRPLQNHPLLTASFIAITATTVLRIVAAISPSSGPWMELATLLWIIALALFAWRYTPILLGPPPAKPD